MLNLHDGSLSGFLLMATRSALILLVDGGEEFVALPAEAGLLLVVDDLVEARVQAIREGLFISPTSGPA